MKKYLLKVVIWILILITIYGADAYVKKQEASQEAYKEIYISKVDMAYGEAIHAEYFTPIKISIADYHEDMYTNLPVGYLKTAIKAQQIILQNQVSNRPLFLMEDSERLITIKCSVVEANGWQFTSGDYVDLVMVPVNEAQVVLENLKVYQTFGSIKDSAVQEYISLIVQASDAYRYYNHLKDSQIFISVKSLN